MSRLFICDTPLQVFTACNLQYHENDKESDLIIVNQFPTAKRLAIAVSEQRMFNTVVVINKDNNKHPDNLIIRKMVNVHKAFFPLQYMKGALRSYPELYTKKYDCIAASVLTIPVIAMLRLNKSAAFMLFEDGLGSYTGNIMTDFLESVNPVLRFYYKHFCKDELERPVNALYVNNPSVCRSTATSNILPLPIADSHFLYLMRGVFPKGQSFSKHFIWLTTPGRTESEIKQVISSLETVSDDVVVRIHPRDKNTNVYNNAFIIDQGHDLWEMSVLENNIENKILISIYSTAQIVPKVYYDKEPILVFLFKIFNEAGPFYETIYELYRDKSRIYLPSSLKELEEIVCRLRCDETLD